MRRIIISRHPAAVEFIRQSAPAFADAKCLSEATPDDVRGAAVAGNLPLHLAALAAEVWAVEFSGIPPRDQEYTIDDMRAAGATLRRYRVTRLPSGTAGVPDFLEWSDRPGPRGRAAWLLLIDRERLVPFTGTSIPGMVAVVDSTYVKEGRWSHTIYRLGIADGVRVIAGRDGWESGSFAEGLAEALNVRGTFVGTWSRLADLLDLPVEEIRRALTEWRPREAARLDAVEEELLTLRRENVSPPGEGRGRSQVSFEGR